MINIAAFLAQWASEWHVYYVLFPRRLIDGTRSEWSELLAGRKVYGKWQYRMPTDQEKMDHFMESW